jgi:hypothetical protein
VSEIRIEDGFPLEKWEVMDRFLAKAYSRRYALRNRKLFEWMFRHPVREDLATVLCAYRGDDLIAMRGYMMTDMFWGNTDEVVLGSWGANWIALKEARTGLGWPLFRKWQNMFEVVLGQRASQDNLGIVAKLGFTVYPRIPRFVRVLDGEGVRRAFAGTPAEPTERYLDRHGWEERSEELRVDVKTVAGVVSTEMYDPEWKQYPMLRYGTIRSRRYLDYKYLSHPFFRYRVLVAGPAKAPALCVYRIEETTGSLRIRVGRIVEFFHPDGRVGTLLGVELLREAMRELKREGCLYCDFYCTSGALQGSLSEGGLVEECEKKLPHRLNPVEFSAGSQDQNLEFYAAKRLGPVPALEEMYVTKSDSDQDRPNMPFLEEDMEH